MYARDGDVAGFNKLRDMIDHPERIRMPSTGPPRHAPGLPGQVQAVHPNMSHSLYGNGGYGGSAQRPAPPRKSSASRCDSRYG